MCISNQLFSALINNCSSWELCLDQWLSSFDVVVKKSVTSSTEFCECNAIHVERKWQTLACMHVVKEKQKKYSKRSLKWRNKTGILWL